MKIAMLMLTILLFFAASGITMWLTLKIKRPELQFTALIIGAFVMALIALVAYVQSLALTAK